MIQQFTTKRDIIRGFANAMNLISPEVQNHHEKVSYLCYRLAEAMGMPEAQKRLAFFGGLMHDIGGVLKEGNVSLLELERDARGVSVNGAKLLRMLPLTDPFASIVQESQTPWERLKRTFKTLHAPQRIGQIVHLADTVTLLLNDKESALNQVDHVKECIHNIGEREFGPDVLAGFDKLCGIEAVWLDVVYRPEIFLDLITNDQSFSLDETVRLTEFMSKIVDFRSPFTAMHSAGVAATAVALAELSNMSEDECGMMRIAGYLHDIGKLKIPNVILDKPGKLTDHEFNIMKEHAYYSWILLKDIRGFETISKWAALHHEKLNGKGYPFHMMKEELTLGSRIMTVADIFSALTENRPYRRSMDKEKVIGILRGDAGSGLISGGVVELLIDHYDAINARRDAESRAASKKYQQSLEKAREA